MDETQNQPQVDLSANMDPVAAVSTNPGSTSILSEDEGSFTVHSPNGVAVLPKDDTHMPIYNSIKTQDQKSIDAWKDLGSGIADAAGAAKDAVVGAVKKIPTPAENMRNMYGTPAPTAPVAAPASLSSAPVQAAPQEPSQIQPSAGQTDAKPVPPPTAGSGSSGLPPGVSLVNLTETTRNQYDPNEVKKMKDFQAAEIDAKKKEMDATNALNTLVQTKADRQSMENAKFIDEEMQRRHQEDVEKGERLAKYNAAKDQYSGLRVDSRRFWNDASTGDKLMATVAMAMAGMGNALQGRAGNPAWDIIDRNIDRDIDEQKANIAQKGRELESERTAYQDFLKATGDERAARLATKELAMQKIADEFQSKIGAATNEVQKQSLMAGLAGAQEKQTQYNMELGKVLVNTKPQVVTKGAPEPLVATEYRKMVDDETKLDQYADLVNQLKSGKIESGRIAELKAQAASKLGVPVDSDSAKLRAQMSTMFNDQVNDWFGGALSEHELENAKKAMAEYSDNPKVATAKLEAILERSAQKANNYRNGISQISRVPETQSKYLMEYRQKFQKSPTTKQ